MASVLALVFITGLMAKLYKDPHLGYASYTYHMLGAIVLTSVFCKSRMLFIITAILLAANAAFFTLVKDMLDPLSLQAAKSGLACSCLMMIIICVLCYLVTYITQSAIKVSLRETKKSEERAELIQKLLDSVREAAEHLVASSGDLSGTASSFSENSQSQASSAEEIMATIEEVSRAWRTSTPGPRAVRPA
jgi:methyl-accepting chemotaxis protein